MPYPKPTLFIILFSCLALASLIISAFERTTSHTIAHHKLQQQAKQIESMMPLSYDNNLIADRLDATAAGELGKPRVPVYRARQNGQTTGVVIFPTAPDGYNGNIDLAISLSYAGEILGVEIIADNETPGFGDQIHRDQSDWLDQFKGKRLDDLRAIETIDQISGASVSATAVQKAIRQCLDYFEREKEALCQNPSP